MNDERQIIRSRPCLTEAGLHSFILSIYANIHLASVKEKQDSLDNPVMFKRQKISDLGYSV
ncbi:hypothetical protein M514_08180 [Trichuris suis]|uniref:Uncharacterized protein n=1 Tax=Trichuris suis TaxID=68888 RepID=A0A085M1A1_9BILA|nr:hypothetical protein M513_08180 [Trichuris suis]KFD71927.1 hypothetical protein M514_08180 [Trichuris suis]